MRRIFAETLSPELLAHPRTLDLISQYELQTLVALPPGRETPAMAEALRALSGAGRGLGLWPLLSDAEGYWPSDTNALAFSARVAEVLAFARRAGARVDTVVVDLEPPLAVMQRLYCGGPAAHLRVLAERIFEASQAASVQRRRAAAQTLTQLRQRLDGQGIETYATVVPLVLLDDRAGRGLWQAVFQTPVFRPGWSRVCPMLYTSMIQDLLPGQAAASARGLAYALARRATERCGVQGVAAAVGLAGPGKLGREPTLATPRRLEEDVGAMRAAGVQDLALFSLEGVLGQPDPEAWLSAFTQTGACAEDLGSRRAWRRRLRWGQVPSYLTRMLKERV